MKLQKFVGEMCAGFFCYFFFYIINLSRFKLWIAGHIQGNNGDLWVWTKPKMLRRLVGTWSICMVAGRGISLAGSSSTLPSCNYSASSFDEVFSSSAAIPQNWNAGRIAICRWDRSFLRNLRVHDKSATSAVILLNAEQRKYCAMRHLGELCCSRRM